MIRLSFAGGTVGVELTTDEAQRLHAYLTTILPPPPRASTSVGSPELASDVSKAAFAVAAAYTKGN